MLTFSFQSKKQINTREKSFSFSTLDPQAEQNEGGGDYANSGESAQTADSSRHLCHERNCRIFHSQKLSDLFKYGALYLILIHLWRRDGGLKRTLKNSHIGNSTNPRIALIQRKMNIQVSRPVSSYHTYFCNVYNRILLHWLEFQAIETVAFFFKFMATLLEL